MRGNNRYTIAMTANIESARVTNDRGRKIVNNVQNKKEKKKEIDQSIKLKFMNYETNFSSRLF